MYFFVCFRFTIDIVILDMSYFQSASSLYSNPGTSANEDTSFADLLTASEADENVVEGRVIYISPISTFEYNIESGNRHTKKGMVQSYILLDVLAKQTKKPIYTYRVTAWNEQVSSRVFKKDEYYRLSHFAWKENSFPRRPQHQSNYDVHLKPSSQIELIPHVPHLQT